MAALRDRERERRSSVIPRAPEAPALLCAACGAHITDDHHRIDVAGTHEHTFANPAGFVFHIGCFGVAPGCVHLGAPDPAFSWFPGFTWQVAACASCRAHVGWIYRKAGEQFHGLILAALRRG